MLFGDEVYFIAENRAPETDVTSKVHLFSMNIYTHQLQYIDTGFDAAFRNDSTIVVGKASLIYHSLFTGEDVYDQTTVTYQLVKGD